MHGLESSSASIGKDLARPRPTAKIEVVSFFDKFPLTCGVLIVKRYEPLCSRASDFGARRIYTWGQLAASDESAEIAANCGALVADGAIGAHSV
jgi:hypothetical protein